MTIPQVYWSSPGVLRHDYPQSEAPIVPQVGDIIFTAYNSLLYFQIEDWKWVWISGDWAIVVWCGSNPMLDYNGGFILSRQKSDGTLPPELEDEMKKVLETFEMSLEGMCRTDSTSCLEWP